MALLLGTNSGFVSTAPTDTPTGTNNYVIDTLSRTTKHTSPSSATKITEIGWWCNNATQETNFEVGLYAADATGGAAGTLLHVSRTNAKGTTSGWKRVAVDWAISPSTSYWIAVQVDGTSTRTYIIYDGNTGVGAYQKSSETTLLNPYPEVGSNANACIAFYALWSAASGPANLKSYNTNLKANIKTINTNPIANVKSLNTNV